MVAYEKCKCGLTPVTQPTDSRSSETFPDIAEAA